MISTNNNTITYTESKKISFSFNLINLINNKIKEEQENSLGITILLIMVSTMIASVAAALAIYDGFSFVYLALALTTAMGTNATAFSQRPFKYVAWAGLISITINTLLVLIQIFTMLL